MNYKGLYFTVQKSIPFLNNKPSIVLVSSIHTYMGMPGRSVYASTKAAVTQLSKSFAADLIDKNIRVNSVSPGFTDTPIMQNHPKEIIDKIVSKIPMQRLAQPRQIAQGILFLASDDSSYITGSDIVIDGGVTSIDNL